MNTHLPGMPLPTDSVLDINIRVTQPLNVTAFCARQRVTRYVMQELSTQLGGDTPDLTVGERVYWSVPVVFTLPGKGILGRVGTLRVDAGTGELLTSREPTSYRRGEQRPAHYLDYFHGALRLSPGGRWVADDGWVWHPVGVPAVWDAHRWLHDHVWESEDGPSWRALCQRAYHWDTPMCWTGENLLAISGIGSDDEAMLQGVRIFDVSTGVEVAAFAGPAGALFAGGGRLYSAAADGLEAWDPITGERTGTIPGFVPASHHTAAGELAGIRGDILRRWAIPQTPISPGA